MALEFRPYRPEDLPAMTRIWNVVVEAGDAFPQIHPLTEETAAVFFAEQSLTTVAAIGEQVFGLYILHPNNVGRCAHVANASYAVAKASRGLGLGRALVQDSLFQARRLGFRGLQFNAVVETNETALHLYDSLGFTRVGYIPHGFVNGAGQIEGMYIYYLDLVDGPATAPSKDAEACEESAGKEGKFKKPAKDKKAGKARKASKAKGGAKDKKSSGKKKAGKASKAARGKKG